MCGGWMSIEFVVEEGKVCFYGNFYDKRKKKKNLNKEKELFGLGKWDQQFHRHPRNSNTDIKYVIDDRRRRNKNKK